MGDQTEEREMEEGELEEDDTGMANQMEEDDTGMANQMEECELEEDDTGMANQMEEPGDPLWDRPNLRTPGLDLRDILDRNRAARLKHTQRGRGRGRGRITVFKRVTMPSTWSPDNSFVEEHSEQQCFKKRNSIKLFSNWQNSNVNGLESLESPRESHCGLWTHRKKRRQDDQYNRQYIDPSCLVMALAKHPTFSASLMQLSRDMSLQMNPANVMKIVSLYSHIFHLAGNMVKLQVQLDICPAHCGPQLCQEHNTCTNLHICPNLVVGKCDNGLDCTLGHNWHTDHNSPILDKLFLDGLSDYLLGLLLRQRYQDIGVQHLAPLSVCAAYNKGGCRRVECSELHVCRSLVTGTHLCSQDDCHLNHNITSPSCSSILKLHGISPNNSPKDILAAMLDVNPKLAENISNGNNSSTSAVSSASKKDVGTPVTAAQHKTQWASYLYGDVVIPEICYHSVEGECKLEGSRCPRLHASRHFHWQTRMKPGKWMNLRTNQVTCLERAFCDPKLDGVDLPRLDPKSQEVSPSGLHHLLGNDIWHAHFPNTASFTDFTLTNSSKAVQVTLELRRLCTEACPDQAITPKLNAWYFLDRKQNWVKYGNPDTTGNTKLVSSVTSDSIEVSYQKSPSAPMSFNHSEFNYILDFQIMKQTNLKTKVQRCVRRRPEAQTEITRCHEITSSEFPSTWDTMPSDQRLKRVTLEPTSEEYKTTVALLAGTGKMSSSMVLKVERIQNPFLWRSFQNKVRELMAIYKDSSKVDIRQLFHGTRHHVVDKICAENFDWRLHGSASGEAYGKGTYFATTSEYSSSYCHPDPSGLRHMLVARVAVGSFTKGNSSMVRPPLNPATSSLFDSTVDNEQQPSIIVKYDKQEYYPEYVITYI